MPAADNDNSLEIQVIQRPEAAQLACYETPPDTFAADLEKAPSPSRFLTSRQGSMAMSTPHVTFVDEPEGGAQDPSEAHLGLTLVHLSTTSPLAAVGLAIYALFALLILLVLSPLRLCSGKTSSTFSSSVTGWIAPVLQIQLRLIYGSQLRHPPPPRLAASVAAALAAPLVALAFMLAAWTVGVFWGFAAIIGEPNQKSRREESEGRAAARAVRHGWETFLLWGLE